MHTPFIEKTPLISLVIPVYNVEKYIEKCLRSCIDQQQAVLGADYEIIIVNDGSPDNSASIAERIIKNKNGCTLINQENKGLGGARNTGIEYANGQYIWFIDSDDWIDSNAIYLLKKYISGRLNPDVIMFRSANVYGEQIKVRQSEFKNLESVKTGVEIFNEGGLHTCVPFQIISRELLQVNSLRFVEGIYHEDNEFMPRLAYYSKRVKQINETLYFVYQNPTSITRSTNSKKSFDIIRVCQNLDTFLKTHDFDKKTERNFSFFISMTLNVAINNIIEHDNRIKTQFNELLASNNQLFKHLISSISPKYVVEGILFYIFKDYIKIYSFLSKFK